MKGAHEGVRVKAKKTPKGLLHAFQSHEGNHKLWRGWMVEPIQRVGRQFDGEPPDHMGLWKWLEVNDWADWDRVHAVASTFHPDYRFDPETREARQLDARFVFAGKAFTTVESGELDRALLDAAWPSVAKMLPKQTRRPMKWHEFRLMVASHLAAHEFGRLVTALEDKHPDEAEVARHLYWCERFYSLWRRIAETNAPPAVVLRKRASAEALRTDLWKFYRARVQSKPGRRVTYGEIERDFPGPDVDPSSLPYVVPKGEGVLRRMLGKMVKSGGP